LVRDVELQERLWAATVSLRPWPRSEIRMSQSVSCSSRESVAGCKRCWLVPCVTAAAAADFAGNTLQPATFHIALGSTPTVLRAPTTSRLALDGQKRRQSPAQGAGDQRWSNAAPTSTTNEPKSYR